MAKEELRLDRLLSNMGYGTRKNVKKIIKLGLVKVNNEIVRKSNLHVNPYKDTILVNEEIVKYSEYIYIIMNKPRGVISATYDNKHKTVIDLLDNYYKGFKLFPMGRLDIDTEGLLILTNNGKLTHEILSPKNHIPKKYFVRVKGLVTEEDGERLLKGVTLDDGYITLPSYMTIIKGGEVSEVELTIYEGKFHQIKRMFEILGKKVIYLKRIAMGSLILDESLKPGEYRELRDYELKLLKE